MACIRRIESEILDKISKQLVSFIRTKYRQNTFQVKYLPKIFFHKIWPKRTSNIHLKCHLIKSHCENGSEKLN